MIVYVLTNPAMPGLVKIGCTDNEDANARIGQLYTSGVPVPFNIEFACRVENGVEVERALHVAFGPHRINPRREFFEIDPEQVVAILRLLRTEEATTEVAQQPNNLDEQSMAAGAQLTARRPNLNFHEMGIPVGSLLQCVDSNVSVTVVGTKRIKFGDDEMSLTKATRLVLNLPYSVAPSPHWTFHGRSLREIYNETYVAE